MGRLGVVASEPTVIILLARLLVAMHLLTNFLVGIELLELDVLIAISIRGGVKLIIKEVKKRSVSFVLLNEEK